MTDKFKDITVGYGDPQVAFVGSHDPTADNILYPFDKIGRAFQIQFDYTPDPIIPETGTYDEYDGYMQVYLKNDPDDITIDFVTKSLRAGTIYPFRTKATRIRTNSRLQIVDTNQTSWE